MGKPGGPKGPSSHTEYIGVWKRTWGTETSQYLQEKKENSIPLVAVSEAGLAQTKSSQAGLGLWGGHTGQTNLAKDFGMSRETG
jgi:hypothetical protein